jgi:flavodoxin
MSKILCVYYSRTGNTRTLMEDIAKELDCELVAIPDEENRDGISGWLRSGMQAMARKTPEVPRPETKLPLELYDLVILGTPVWAGRCSAPMRGFLTRYGEELRRVAYVITRASDSRYEEVFDQMDLYVKAPHVKAVSIRPNTVGSTFWRDDFLSALRSGGKEEQDA